MKSRVWVVFRFAALLASVAMPLLASECFAAPGRPDRRPPRDTHEASPAVPLAEIRAFGGRPAPFALNAKSAMLVDGRTGTALYEYHEHVRIQPASLAKIMTFYLTLEALSDHRISLDTRVTVSEAAWRLSMDRTVSRMFLGVGEQVAVRDLLYGLMVSSGNDAAVALAEYLGGSSEGFTRQMNGKARELGLTETHFMNPDGLPAEGEYTTAADMTSLARALLGRFPAAVTYTAAKEFTFGKIKQRNFNTLLFHDPRVNGIKTGHVAEAGYHLVASATSDGVLLVTAVMGTPSMEKRRTETGKLVDWGFRTFATIHPDWRKAVPASIPVYQGVADMADLAPNENPFVTVERGKEDLVTLSWEPRTKFFVAPVKKGTVAGELTVMQQGKPVASIPVVTQSDVARGGFFKRMRDRLRMML